MTPGSKQQHSMVDTWILYNHEFYYYSIRIKKKNIGPENHLFNTIMITLSRLNKIRLCDPFQRREQSDECVWWVEKLENECIKSLKIFFLFFQNKLKILQLFYLFIIKFLKSIFIAIEFIFVWITCLWRYFPWVKRDGASPRDLHIQHKGSYETYHRVMQFLEKKS